MANSRSSDTYKEFATVDTQPSGTALGYWTNEVCLRDKIKAGSARKKMFFSIREYEPDSSGASNTSSMTVTLQFMRAGDTGWQDWADLSGNTLAVGNVLVIEDTAAGSRWRAGVKDGDYTSGKITFGFDW